MKVEQCKTLQQFWGKNDRKRWCKLTASNGRGGYCLYGGVTKIYGRRSTKSRTVILARIREAIERLFGESLIAAFNDRAATRYEDIRRVVKEARV